MINCDKCKKWLCVGCSGMKNRGEIKEAGDISSLAKNLFYICEKCGKEIGVKWEGKRGRGRNRKG